MDRLLEGSTTLGEVSSIPRLETVGRIQEVCLGTGGLFPTCPSIIAPRTASIPGPPERRTRVWLRYGGRCRGHARRFPAFLHLPRPQLDGLPHDALLLSLAAYPAPQILAVPDAVSSESSLPRSAPITSPVPPSSASDRQSRRAGPCRRIRLWTWSGCRCR